ncbi:hypothetical protein DL769_002599 [Monosporascus sp. CRB-8-3]|nr:hypothetical protein DL769_002599 [Monosporascus sp. CRB-8-3]
MEEDAKLDLVDSSNLTYFIPQATKFRLEDELKDVKGPHEDAFKSIERRESLFFDESVDVYLVLQTPHVQDDTLRTSLERIVIDLEAQIINGGSPERDHPPSSEVIYSGTVDDSEDPFIVADGPAESSHDERFIYAVWKLPVFLGRPRIRLQSPSAVFTATASLKPADASVVSNELRGGYMQSGMPSGLNLLEAFGNDPGLNGVKPRLSALRVSCVAPVTQQAKDLLRPIKSLPKLSHRIYPAAHSRIRFSRPNTATSSAAIIAMLEVDFTPFFECEIMLDTVKLSVRGGVVNDLTHEAGLTLPLSCVAHDHVTFLYRIAPAEEDIISRYPTRELDISIGAVALVQPGLCEPRLSMAWTATVDLTLPLNPGYGPALQPIQRSHRPSQLSIGGGDNTASLTAPAVARPDSLPSLEAAAAMRSPETSLLDLGLTVTVSAPPATQKIYPGDVFAWNVFVVNRAPAASATPTVPRKLALVPIPRRRRAETRVNRPPSVSSSGALRPHPLNPPALPADANGHGHIKRASQQQQQLPPLPPNKDRSVADAVLDEAVVHAMQRCSVLDDAPLASLSADARVGPLAPGACHAVELRFLALRAGIHAVEAVRVVDLGSNEHVDIRDLPLVVVESR